jgi:hypothetical protein
VWAIDVGRETIAEKNTMRFERNVIWLAVRVMLALSFGVLDR